MSSFQRHVQLGTQWLNAGARLVLRDRWRYLSMGFFAALIVNVVSIPFLGGPLFAFIAPMLFASFCVSLAQIGPRAVGVAAIKQAPAALFSVFREERHMMPMALVSLASMVASLFINALTRMIAGSAWTKPLANLSAAGFTSVFAAMLVAAALYFVCALALAYTVPRVFVRGKPLVSEMPHSFKAGRHYWEALLVILACLLVPPVVAAAIAFMSTSLGIAAMLLANTFVLPWVAASVYSSYRTIFQPKPAE